KFRRGTYPASILSIAFSLDSSLMCAASESGTVHVFKVEDSKYVMRTYFLLPSANFFSFSSFFFSSPQGPPIHKILVLRRSLGLSFQKWLVQCGNLLGHSLS